VTELPKAHNVQEPSEAQQVMWGQVSAKNGFRGMAYDVPSRMPWGAGMNAFFVSVRGDSAAEITALWEKLSAGAAIAQPLAPSGWAPLYGMLKDRFGVTWVLDVATEYKAA
jgi:PhnB protein